MVKCPCRNCQERKEDCHASCQLYLNYKNEKHEEVIYLKAHIESIDYGLQKMGARYDSGRVNKAYYINGRII